MTPIDKAIRDLVALLNSEDKGEAEEAQYELASYGTAILPPLLEAVPSLDPFGQLCAIELLQGLGDPRAGAVLIPMLRSEDDTVRDWAASALGELHLDRAVPELRRAYEEVKRRGTPLDWTEPMSLRGALTQLGAREEVVPSPVARLSRSEHTLGRCWPVEDLVEVIDALADADQLVLYFMFWKRRRKTHTWKLTPSWELDWALPWRELVEAARGGALDAARKAGTPEKTVATVYWMNEHDR
jgi:HEAT repeats